MAAAMAFLPLAAQTRPERKDYLDRYNLLVSKLGIDGVGVETLLQRWGNDYPEDLDMLLGKFTYYLKKSQTTSIEKMDVPKYLGEAPALSLKDSTGKAVNYFQVINYDDELFGKAAQSIDKAIEIAQDRLDLRLFKLSSLLAYEKESPDMAVAGLKALVDYNCTMHPAWDYPGLEMKEETFPTLMQDYCVALFKTGTPSAFEGFRSLSEKLSGYYPRNPVFMTNLGSYYLVHKHDNKTAQKMYNKVLKKNPDDYIAIKNMVLLARNGKNVKLEKKFLQKLIQVTEDETEKASAEARLKAI